MKQENEKKLFFRPTCFHDQYHLGSWIMHNFSKKLHQAKDQPSKWYNKSTLIFFLPNSIQSKILLRVLFQYILEDKLGDHKTFFGSNFFSKYIYSYFPTKQSLNRNQNQNACSVYNLSL